MSTQHKIKEIVRRSSSSAWESERLSTVYRRMKSQGLKYLPVLEGEDVIGIVSRTDIRRLGFGYELEGCDDVELGLFDMLQVGQVMIPDPPTVSTDTTAEEAVRLMVAYDLPALPVLEQSRVTGTVDIHDLASMLLHTGE